MAISEIAMWSFRPSPGKTNFGDQLGVEIVKKMGFKVREVPLQDAELIASGSVLQLAANRAKPGCKIWGAGLLTPAKPNVSKLDIHAVRGALTASNIGFSGAVGDPGCLAYMFYNNHEPKKYKVGFVRHYVDSRQAPWADITIPALASVDETIEKISQCERIVSSSLHGLIVAQSFHIPAVRWPHDKVLGGDFKWLDYATGATEELVNSFPY